MILYQSDYLTIEFRTEKSVLISSWCRQTNNYEYENGWHRILHALHDTCALYWLSDVRKLANLDMATQRWTIDTFCQQINNTQLLKFAQVITPDIFHQIITHRMFEAIQHSCYANLQLEAFTDLHTAIKWLIFSEDLSVKEKE
ncbi:MAG: hypothetical protein LPJ89_00115 [Hymenobacteraceae bacterium]|nr:hypothetical protein [Hymenobacteraceae bacterium]MDX5394637.1 hypothetical protein [Hymenobacteraceae bacterium]MDX5442168.1 hypothetical protein [Hymenobacteraceae bacterium]MDX5510668.1 hypothetical protein [Hymenobacteraceae bacterium]